MVLLHEHDHCMFCLTTGPASGSNDAAQRRLDEIDADAELLKAAWDSWRKIPGDKASEKEVQSYERRLASLDERRKDLKAQLSGATHADAWALLPAYVSHRHISWLSRTASLQLGSSCN